MGGSSSAGAVPRTLEDVVALVMCQDPVANAKAAVTSRIESHGGRVVARLGKDVSHIIWERTRSRRPRDKEADEAQLLELFHKLEKLDYPPVVVSPLWVEESIKAGRRLVERKYLVKKPTESLLGRTPGSGGAAAVAAKKRKRPAAVLPKPAEAYELDDGAFSSTQQMHSSAKPAGEPRGSKHQRRSAGTGKKQGPQAGGSKGARGAASVAMPTVAEEEDGWDDDDDDDDDDGHGQPQQHSGGAGTETQAVANILTIDLPDEEHGGTPGSIIAGGAGGGEEEEDELDTPLALRFAKSSAERGATWGASEGSGKGSAEQAAGRGGAGAGTAAGGDRRSRLALASGPRQEGEAADGEGGPQLEAEAMEIEEVEPQGDEQAEQEHAEAGQQQQRASKAAAAAKGVAERFSVRQLQRHPEKPVIVHKGTPLPGRLPSSPADEPTHPIPIPQVERVVSPWTLAEQALSQSQSQSQVTQPAAASGRPSIGQAAPKAGGRRSLLGVSNMRRASNLSPAAGGVNGAGATPASAAHGPQPEGEGAAGAELPPKLPTPWSTLRPWDGKAGQQQQAAGEGGAGQLLATAAAQDENQAGPPQRQPQGRAQQQGVQQADQPSAAAAAPGASGSSRRQWQAQDAATAAATTAAAAMDASSAGAGPTHGCIALTCVDAAVVDLARSATRRLRGLRLCPEGKEDGQVTHLIMGDEKRTLKLMLAVANGAWLLSPQWVTASLEAGRWLPESQFSAKVRFEAAAERARSLLESPDAAPLLGEHSMYIHLPDKTRKLMGPNAAALKRVAAALGAKATPARSCTLCVVVGGGSRPPTIPASAACVKEEWVLQAIERFEQPPLEDYAVD